MAKQTTKQTKAATKAAPVREGWKVGTPKRADGTTGTNDCLCGCGTKVKRLFAQGHDARVHSWLLAIERDEKAKNSLPAITQDALAKGVLVIHASNPQDGHVLSAEARSVARKLAARKDRKVARVKAMGRASKTAGKKGGKLPLSGLAAKAALTA